MLYFNNKTYPSDIADGISIYEKRKADDAYAAKGGQFIAPYSYGNYIFHAAIAFIAGVIAASIIGGAFGVISGILIGIASFVLLFIIHWHKEQKYLRYPFSNYKSSYFQKLKKYTIITVIAAVIIAIIINVLIN